MQEKKKIPIVYSCSGCSSAAQMANALAIRLDREGLAEMSCIAGVGGDVSSLVRTAKSGRDLWVLDGCPLTCSKQCLARHLLQANEHFVLSEMKVPKRIHGDFDPQLADQVYEMIKARLLKADLV